MAPSHILQVSLRVAVQNQIRIAQWVIVDEIIQLRPLHHGHIQGILDPGAVDEYFSPIPEQQFYTPSVHVKAANFFIVLHNRILLKSLSGLYWSIYDFGFHLPRTPALNFPKKTNNNVQNVPKIPVIHSVVCQALSTRSIRPAA